MAWLIAMSGVVVLGVAAPTSATALPTPVAPTLRYGLELPATFAEYHGGYASYTSDAAGNIIFSTGTFPGYLLRGTPGGALTVVAGTGVPGYSGDGSSASAAQVGTPDAIKVGSDGSIYFVDGQAVRRIAPDGTIDHIAGNVAASPGDCSPQPVPMFEGPAVCLYFLSITDLSVGTDGSVLTFESLYGFPPIPGLPTSPFVRSINNGVATMVAQSSQDGSCSGIPGPASTASFGQLSDAAAGNDGTVYLATTCQSPTSGADSEILAIDSTGAVSVVAGGGSTAMAEGVVATDSQFMFQPALSTDATGRVYATLLNYFSGASQLWMVGLDGLLHLVASGSGTAFAEGSSATSVAFRTAEAEPSGSVLVSSADPYGTGLGRIANGTLTVLNAGTPWVEPADGGNAAGHYLSGAVAMGFDRSGDLYYSSGTSPVVRTIRPTGVMGTRAGNGQMGTHIDGPATQSPLGTISDLSVDTRGNLAIATSNGVVRVSSSGDLASVADGGAPLTAETVVLGEDGTIFSSTSGWCPAFDCRFSTVNKVSPSGLVSTVYTQPTTAGVYSTITGGALSPTTGKLSGVTSYRNALWTLDPETGVATASPIPTGINHVAIDPAGTVFYESNGIHRVEPDGSSVLVGAPTPEIALGATASAMAIDPTGNIWIAVPGPFGVRLYSYAGLAAHLPPLPPSAPTGVGSGTQITVTLPTPPTGGTPIDSYEVQISTTADGTFSVPVTGTCASPLDAAETSCTITDLVPGTAYYIKLRALAAGMASDWSPASGAITVPSTGGGNFFAGRVLRASGTPVAGADVVLRPIGAQYAVVASGTTDSFGRFRIQIDPGQYWAAIVSGSAAATIDHSPNRFVVDLSGGNFVQDITLPTRTPLTIEVVDADGAPVPNTVISPGSSGDIGSTALWPGGPAISLYYGSTGCTTGSNATCDIDTWIGNGVTGWKAVAPNGATAFFSTPAVATPNPSMVQVHLPRVYTFSGVLRESDGTPVPNASLSTSTSSITTAADGSFSLTASSTLLFLSISTNSFVTTDRIMVDLSNGNLQQDIILPPRVQVRFTVADSTGNPVAGYQVTNTVELLGSRALWPGGPTGQFKALQAGSYAHYCVTNANGICSITTYAGAGSSTWDVTQLSTGSKVHSFTLGPVPDTGPVEKAVQLPPPPTVTGRLIDSVGNPVANAFVFLRERSFYGAFVASTTTNANGEYSLTTSSGHYMIVIKSGSYGLELKDVYEIWGWGLDIDLTAGNSVVPDIVRPQVAPLQLTLTDAAGTPIPNASLRPPAIFGIPSGTDIGETPMWPGGPNAEVRKPVSCNLDQFGVCTDWTVVGFQSYSRTATIPDGPITTFTVPGMTTSTGAAQTLRVGGFAKLQSAGITSGAVSVVAPSGATLSNITNTPIADNTVPSGDLTPTGTLAYSVTVANAGDAADVTLQLPAGSNPTGVFKVVNGVYTDYTSFASITGDTIVVHLVDGGQGDADGLANGVIVDPVVPVTTAYELTLAKSTAGAATGSVTSDIGGLTCGVTCKRSYLPGTTVTLTATPGANSVFTGWTGGTCTGTGSCTVTMGADTSVSASFVPTTSPVTVSKAGAGSGSITSAPGGISCGATCTAQFDNGSTVTLTAVPDANSVFSGWSGGGCTGTAPCNVSVSAATNVTATFTLKTYTLTVTKAGTGSGSVTSNPAGISCGSSCSTSVTHGSQVSLTAAPAVGSVFAGWSGGGCTGTGTCTVTLTAATTVTATFNPAPATTLPSAPGKPVATASNGFLTVSWTAPTVGAPFTDYLVQRATSSAGTYTTVTSGTCAAHPSTATSCTVTGLTNGTTYYFKVKAVNAAGTGPASVASAGVKAVAVPDEVGSLTCTKVITRTVLGSARIAWTAAATNGSSIIRYEYASKRTSSNTWGGWTTNGTLRSVTITGLTKNVGYDVRVRAVNGVGAGPAVSCSVTP